jgi:hypothetical protein
MVETIFSYLIFKEVHNSGKWHGHNFIPHELMTDVTLNLRKCIIPRKGHGHNNTS